MTHLGDMFTAPIANKWQSQYIRQKFKRKHKNINYPHTQKANKRNYRRKQRRIFQLRSKQYALNQDYLNVYSNKSEFGYNAFRKDYSKQKERQLHPNSPQLKITRSQWRFCVKLQFFYNNSWHPYNDGYCSYIVSSDCNYSRSQYCDVQVSVIHKQYQNSNVMKCCLDDKRFHRYYISEYNQYIYVIKCYKENYCGRKRSRHYISMDKDTTIVLGNIVNVTQLKSEIDARVIAVCHDQIMKEMETLTSNAINKVFSETPIECDSDSVSSIESVDDKHNKLKKIQVALIMEKYDKPTSGQHSLQRFVDLNPEISIKIQNFVLTACSIEIDNVYYHSNDTNWQNIPICVAGDEVHQCLKKEKYYWLIGDDNCPIMQIAKESINLFGQQNNICRLNDTVKGLVISECHEPHYNLLPLSCHLSRLLYSFIPSNDILKNVLVPYIGYDKFYYVLIDGEIIGEQSYFMESFNYDSSSDDSSSDQGSFSLPWSDDSSDGSSSDD